MTECASGCKLYNVSTFTTCFWQLKNKGWSWQNRCSIMQYHMGMQWNAHVNVRHPHLHTSWYMTHCTVFILIQCPNINIYDINYQESDWSLTWRADTTWLGLTWLDLTPPPPPSASSLSQSGNSLKALMMRPASCTARRSSKISPSSLAFLKSLYTPCWFYEGPWYKSPSKHLEMSHWPSRFLQIIRMPCGPIPCHWFQRLPGVFAGGRSYFPSPFSSSCEAHPSTPACHASINQVTPFLVITVLW